MDVAAEMWEACKTGDCAVLGAALQAGAEGNTQNGEGSTPIHRAMYHNQAGAVRLLLAHPEIR